ncbi:RluA family pseudouridine synthase [Planctomicrobium piriforme]|uniref:Pseudouridine synthase n=1 Tax=Planctomicrobium piriforme TaxID=1576369 RepID=A0A1I3DKC0_9PLAN|nr:RluA family pseudouridine synthase [Planctomicrobium piriforme]SFH86988.1 23S rRNA pseudouridine1911/1915/1917 synthase [Planctomicrobium piriforme]
MPSPIFEFVVEPDASGIRIDSFLIRHLRNYSSWRLQRIVREGGATINNAPAEQTDRVFSGQRICVRLLEPPDKLLDPAPLDLEVLYEDPWMMVVNKPAGVIVHPVGEDQSGTLANVLQRLLDERSPIRGLLRPGIVHRLDRQTSGAIAVAITHDAHAALSASFEASRVAKTYLALVEGRVEVDSGSLDWAIGRARSGRHVLMSCRADAVDRKPARTYYEVVERFENHTLVLAKPRTGRNHQIRVHFAALGHPLVGDEFYETQGRFKPFHADIDAETSREVETGLPIRRHALHALKLELAHPVSGAWLEVSAPPPEDFQETLRVLRTGDSEKAKR